MAKLVEIGDPPPRALTMLAGDMLNFPASGGFVESGDGVVEALGPYTPAVVGLDGRLLSPESPPTTMLFRAARPGRARLAIFTGGGLMPTARTSVDILVEGEGPRSAG